MHGAPPLYWNNLIADSAQGAVNTIEANGGRLQHEQQNKFGENLASGPTQDPYAAPVNRWWDEFPLYNGSFSSEAGHFTAMTWLDVTDVGCARSGRTVACRYWSEAGDGPNFIRRFSRNVQQFCSNTQAMCEAEFNFKIHESIELRSCRITGEPNENGFTERSSAFRPNRQVTSGEAFSFGRFGRRAWSMTGSMSSRGRGLRGGLSE